MRTKSRQVALGGIISALCVAFIFLSGIVPGTMYVLPMAAGAMIMLMAVEVGNKAALCAWVSVSVLSMLLAPDRHAAMMFLAFFGYYPILKQKLERLPGKVPEYACKLLIYNACVALAYLALVFVFGMAEVLEGMGVFGRLAPLVMLVGGSIMFIFYDILLTRCYTLYMDRYRQKLFGGAKWGS